MANLFQNPASKNTHLILKARALTDPKIAAWTIQRFINQGVDASRIECRGWSSRNDLLAQYADVDLALDPFPFTGGLTTFDALYMGTPVITLRGSSAVARQGASILKAAGLEEFITNSIEDYIDKAIQISQAKPFLRIDIRHCLASSPLSDAKRYAQDVTNALYEIYANMT